MQFVIQSQHRKGMADLKEQPRRGWKGTTAMRAQKRSKLSMIKSNLMIDDSMYAASTPITKENEGPKSQASMICNARACHVDAPVMKSKPS
jgi:hypothetical protein